MKPKSSSDRRILTLLPVVLASLLIVGTTRLLVETSHCTNGCFHALHHLLPSIFRLRQEEGVEFFDELKQGCNLFEGKWVLDEDGSYPLYTEDSCPYLTRQVTCQNNGRPDSLYQRWKWRPHACELPRFDAVKLLEFLKNKRLMFIGDSIQRTQWESMVCKVQSAIPDSKKSVYKDPPRKIFVAEEYNATIEFYWAPFLVESNADHATNHRIQKRLVKLDTIEKHSHNWEEVDVMVFDSYIWWMNKPFINASFGSTEFEEYDVPTAYRLALKTWANWLQSSINPQTQRAFFMTLSPTHLWSWEWGGGSNANCFNESQPIKQDSYWGVGSSLDMMSAVRNVVQDLEEVNVTLLNITQLSEYRKDGHTSIYSERRGELLTREQKSDPDTYADCIHWCLPGVPDVWNEILFAYLLYS